MKAEFPEAKIPYVPGTQFLSNKADPVPICPDHSGWQAPASSRIDCSRPSFDAKPTSLTSRVESSVNLNVTNVPELAKGISGLSVQWTG